MNSHRFAAILATLTFLLMGGAGVCGENASPYVKKSPGAASVIVFVHGIFGSSKDTWTSANGTYFPALLGQDELFSDFDVYVYEYPSRFLGAGFSIDEIAENMRLLFDTDLVTSYKEIVFVSHSMGGLVTRAYLNKNIKISDRVRLAYFFSTPTTGSEIASIGSLISSNPHLSKMKPMQSDTYLGDLQRQWLSLNFGIPSFCAYEKQATYGLNIVTQASASNLCNRALDPIDANHLTIVKPVGLRDTPFLVLKSALQKTPRKTAFDNQLGTIGPTAGFLTQDALQVRNYGQSTHTAFLSVRLKFADSRFNHSTYFAAFEKIDARFESGGDPTSSRRLNVSVVVRSPRDDEFALVMSLSFSNRPVKGDRLIISIGPMTVQHVVTESTFKWETLAFSRNNDKEKERSQSIAFSEVWYELPRPSWPTITDARILEGQNGVSLLRITLSNPTDTTYPVSYLKFSARHPRLSSQSCGLPDRTQEVVLRWEKQGGVESPTAVTNLDGVEIPVRMKYRLEGMCSNYSIEAEVPLSELLPGNTTKILSLRLKELPTLASAPKTARGPVQVDAVSVRLGRIASWPDITISAISDPSTPIFPDIFKVGLQSTN